MNELFSRELLQTYATCTVEKVMSLYKEGATVDYSEGEADV